MKDNITEIRYGNYEMISGVIVNSLMEEIEELKGKIDEVILQEIQSLKEQIKILCHILYHEDVRIGDCIKGLTTEGYQLFVENNKLEELK